MTNNATKTYLVGVIERAIAYYKVEARDARTAAENWQEGEFYARDDEALDTEGPCNVRERQHDGTWRKLPKSEWEAEPAAGTVTSAEGKTTPGSGHSPEPWTESGMAIIQDAYGNIVADCDSPDLPPGWHRVNARRIVAAVNACKGIGTEALESGIIWEMQEALKRAEFLMRRVHEGDHRALENLRSAADQAGDVIARMEATGSARPQTVLVEVQGGFADITATPWGLATVIVDWDLIRTEDDDYLRSVIDEVKGSSLEEAEKARLIAALEERLTA